MILKTATVTVFMRQSHLEYEINSSGATIMAINEKYNYLTFFLLDLMLYFSYFTNYDQLTTCLSASLNIREYAHKKDGSKNCYIKITNFQTEHIGLYQHQ